MLEREKHRTLLRSLIHDSLSGRGRVLLVEGVVASGRTALLREAVETAEQAGMLAMRASCSPMEKDLPGSTLSQLLLSVPAHGGPAEHTAPDYHKFCRQTLRLAAEAPLVVAVDDIHYADPESARCLLYLARRLGAARVLLAVTSRRDDDLSQSPFAAELPGDPRVHRVGVEPLTETGTALLLEERLGALADAPGLAAESHRISGGNLRLLDALADDCRRGGAGRDHATEQGYGAAVVDLLRRWESAVLRITQVLAVLGERGTPGRVARLAGLDREGGTGTVKRVTAMMTAAGLLRDGRFPHPAGRAAVLGTLTGAERALLNQRAAELLHSLGEPAQAVACHLTEARQRVAPWAVPVLVEAAEQDLLADRNRRAALCLELAYESCDDPTDRAAVLAKLADAKWQRNPSAAARYLTPLVAAAQTGNLGHDRLPGLVRQLLWHGRHGDATAVLGRLRDAASSEGALADEARNLDSWLMFSHPQLARRGAHQPAVRTPFGGLPPGRDVAALSGNDPWLALAASLCGLLVSGRTGGRTDWLERSLRNLRPRGNTPWAHEAASLALLGLLELDLPDVVLERCAVLSAPDDPERAPTWYALLESLRAEALLRRGDLTGALRAARETLTVLPAHGWGVTAGFPLGTLVTAAVRSGALEEAERYLAFSPPEVMFQNRYGLYYLHARGHYHLSTQRAYAGLADFLACGDLVQALGLEAAAPVPWRTSAAQAWLRLGNDDRARRLVREQLACSDAAGGSGRGRALRMLAAVSSPERRPQLLLEAVELFEECGDQYEQAQVLADLGYAYSALGDSRRARTALRRARHLALSCGAAPLCEELLASRETPDAPVPRRDDTRRLTESERRVAHLAVLGYTNREIAAKLYITPSTVEQHLTKVYRKLDVKRRRDLPADLGTATLRRQPRQAQRPSASRSAS
ncbi:helix-turn-helix transcriptional regulator [Streptomyces carminius]|uniref:helix-turn-helix transcriptional regulator n=1 Tax=Streptomyces carminius TaxID=2665496 RepID=UPI0013041FC9|nr:LuxR family transcriptional regulator [Streptomyces carminius]